MIIKVQGFVELKKAFKQLEKNHPALRTEVVNHMAFSTRKRAIANAQKTFTLRNRYTIGSIRVVMARRSNPAATVGSIQEYMAQQEFGDSVKSKGIHTKDARITKDEKKLVSTNKRRSKLLKEAVSIKSTGLTAHQRIARIREAQKDGLPMKMVVNGRLGLYKFKGPSRKSKFRLLVDLSQNNVKIKSTPWFTPALQGVQARATSIFTKTMRKMLASRR